MSSSAYLRIPIRHPIVSFFSQEIPIQRHSNKWLIHPRRQPRAIQVVSHRQPIILLCRVNQTFSRSDKLVKALRFFFVRGATNYRNAVDNDRCSTRRQDVPNRKVLLLLEQPHVRHAPQRNQTLAPRNLLHEQRSVGGVLMNISVELT